MLRAIWRIVRERPNFMVLLAGAGLIVLAFFQWFAVGKLLDPTQARELTFVHNAIVWARGTCPGGLEISMKAELLIGIGLICIAPLRLLPEK